MNNTPQRIPFLALILGALAMFGPFSIDAVFPAFLQIGAQFAVDQIAVQQIISVYLLAYALMSLLHGPLSDALGRRVVILVGLAVFAVASAGCALAQDLPTLLAFRALQGMSAGVGLIVGRAVIRDVFSGDAAQRLMAQVSMIFGVAPALAPVIGGWLLGYGRWPLIFWFLLLFSLPLLALVWFALPETHPPAQRTALQLRPLLENYWKIVKKPQFLRLSGAAAFNFSALFLFISSAPELVMQHLQLSEQQFGWFFVPMISGMMAGAFLSGKMAGKVPLYLQVRLGFLCCGLAAAANISYHALVDSPTVFGLVTPIVILAFGIALVFPVVTLMLLDMFPQQRGGASSLQAFTSLLLNALMAGIASPLLSHDLLQLAGVAGVCTLLGWLLWTRSRRADLKQAQ